MKSKARSSSYFSANPLKIVPNDASIAAKKDTRSPYLKAVLSGANNKLIGGNLLSVVNSDRDAALRYIRETSQLHKK